MRPYWSRLVLVGENHGGIVLVQREKFKSTRRCRSWIVLSTYNIGNYVGHRSIWAKTMGFRLGAA